MKALTVEDIINVNTHVRQVFGDYFFFDNQMIEGKLVYTILGKLGAIPDDIASKIIEELEEFKYVSQTVDVAGFGNSVIVIGRGE